MNIKMMSVDPKLKFAETYKNDKDKTVNKKKKLLEKFINVTKVENVKDSEELKDVIVNNNDNNNVNSNNNNKEYSKELRQKDKQINNLQKELVLKNNELKDNKSTISLLKKEIYDLKQKNILNESTEILSLRNKITEQENTLVKIQEDVLNRLPYKDNYDKLVEDNKSYRSTFAIMKLEHQELRVKYEKLKTVLTHINTSTVAEDLKKHKEIIMNMSIELQHFKYLSENYKESLTILDLIDELIVRFNDTNYMEYEKIYSLYKLYFNKMKFGVGYNCKSDEQKIDDNVNIEFGWLRIINNRWFFVGTNYKTYPIINTVPYMKNGIPAKAIVEFGLAKLIKAFQYYSFDYDMYEENSLFINKYKRKNNNTDEYVNFGNFTVLIVGSQYKNQYMGRLKKHGLNVLWFDSFDVDDVNKLEVMIKHSDIVIICRRHTRHYVNKLVNMSFKDNDKFQFIEKDNEDSIVGRVRFAGIKLGLIKMDSD